MQTAPNSKLKIALIYGGKSAESEVSVHSAENIGLSADKNKYEVFPIFIDRAGRWILQNRAGETDPEAVLIIPCA
ncbi:MAG: hypothetical protein NTW04_00780, partial [Elusimicrobia bacterium]|nr:hypothetical protein [Elusimicrobiota bacterium]